MALSSQLQPTKQGLNNQSQVSRPCGECEEEKIVSFCDSCQNFLCELCDQAHKRMASFKSHLLVPPDQAKLKPEGKKFWCSKHPSEALSVYCIKCKIVICRDCAVYDHHTSRVCVYGRQNYKPAVEASDEIRKSLVSDSKQLKTNLETFCSHAEKVAKVEKHVTIYPDTMKSFITSQFDELHKQLDERKEALLQQVDAQYNGFSKTLWIEKDIVETGICKLEAGIKNAEQLAKSDDKLEVAVLGSKAVASMQQVASTLSWDPKTIENLGPLAYAVQEPHHDKNLIETMGRIKNLPHFEIIIIIKDGSYIDYLGNFQENGTYCIEIEVNINLKFKIHFPEMKMLCSCTNGNNLVPCTTERKQDKWEVRFQTKYSGAYAFEAVLEIGGEVCCKKSKALYFISSTRLSSGLKPARVDPLSSRSLPTKKD